jgi:hypothetical protein
MSYRVRLNRTICILSFWRRPAHRWIQRLVERQQLLRSFERDIPHAALSDCGPEQRLQEAQPQHVTRPEDRAAGGGAGGQRFLSPWYQVLFDTPK